MSSNDRVRTALAVSAFLFAALGATGCMKPWGSTCPSGRFCPSGSQCAARQDICITTSCGDGVLQTGEVCDDGNVTDGDGCSADCKSNETCGNNIKDVTVGEVCDDGNTVAGDGCSADCKSLEGWGNGIVDPGEDCDGGDSGTVGVAKETAICNSDCTFSKCGDGKPNASDLEECDDGNSSNSDACLNNCKWNTCGDGYRNGQGPNHDGTAEECDLGSQNATDTDCTYGLPSCTKCDTACKAVAGTPHVCGDGTQDTAEICDHGAKNGATACDYGTPTCSICNTHCSARIARTGPYCNDGKTDGDYGEVCDDGARNGTTACLYGQLSCAICDTGCQNTHAGTEFHYCGDGILDGSEQCDNPYSKACGTCSDTCGNVAIDSATGTITVHGVPADGDRFSLDPGTKSAVVTFEFDASGGCTVGNQCISIVGLTDLSAIAAQVVPAIRSASIGIDAAASGDTVSLTNVNDAGHTGNTAIEISSSSSALSATAMAGGVGCLEREKCGRYRSTDCLSDDCEDHYYWTGVSFEYAYSSCKSN